jgi:hypothetical protein
MSIAKLGRALVSYGVGVSLALQGIGALVPSTVRAASPELKITEINWAGSTSSTSDQWIEMVNAGALPITFDDATPYTLVVGSGADEVTYNLGTSVGILNPGQYLVVRKNAFSNSSLRNVVTAVHTRISALALPSVPTEYRVYADDATLVDVIADPDGAGPLTVPFAGTAQSTSTIASSMSRVDVMTQGSDAANWYTSRTLGRGFKVAAPEQYGTPSADNVDLAAPSASVSPEYSTTSVAAPVVSGSASAPANRVTVRFTRVSYDPSATPVVREYQHVVAGPDHNFNIVAAGLPAGRYTVEAFVRDATGNRSQTVRVPAASGSTEYFYVVAPVASSVPAPVLDAVPALTNQPEVTVSGSLASGTTYHSLEVLRNGAYYGTFPVAGSTFSFPVILAPNQVNEIEVIAVDESGDFSDPASATAEHDGIAPNPVDVSKVVVTASHPGSDDLIQGQPGAAEAGATLFVYGDMAQTIALGAVTVAADGSFPEMSIGDNLYEKVYLVLQDAAGNRSTAAVIDNPVHFVAGNLNPTLAHLNSTEATIGWTEEPSAVKYRIKYRTADGTYGSAMEVCVNGNGDCSFKTTIKGLLPDTHYHFAIAAVDYFGNESDYEELEFHTKPAPVVVPSSGPMPAIGGAVGVALPGLASSSGSTGSRVTTSRVQPSPTPVTEATPTPTPVPTPEEDGEVSGEATTRNWTPWIVLGALIALAALATAGYFYWFGGQAGEAALASVMAERARREEEVAAAKATEKGKKAAGGSKSKGKDRRW